jgi:hypothetical protein
VGSKTMTINGKTSTLLSAVNYSSGNVYVPLQVINSVFGMKSGYSNGLIWISSATIGLTSSDVKTLLNLFA